MNQFAVTAINSLQLFFHKTGQWLKKTFLHPNSAMKTVYLLTIVGILCYGYTWINHYFTVPLGGDYTLQEMTFIFNGYDDWHQFFRTGQFPTWDRSVFLGVDNVGANAFYYIFDPFFLILLPFPRDWLLVLQGISFVPKMVIGGMLFYWYLSSFGFADKTRRLGALAYGFCGYTFGYLWFHFIDSVAFLPLILLGVERVIQRRDPRILLIGFFINAMTSYFFFVVYMIGGFLYAIFRFLQTLKQRQADENWAVIGCGFFAFFIGVFLGAFTLLPGMSMALNMPRVSNKESYLDGIRNAEGFKEIIKAIFTWEYQQSRVTPLLNFLFMEDGCYYSNLLNVYWYDNFASSLYATTPLLLLFFVSVCDSIKEKKVGHVIGLALTIFLILSPIGFYLFSGFTVGYARYFILPLSWMIVFDLESYEKRRNLPAKYLDLSVVMTLVLYIVSCVLMIKVVNENPNSFTDATSWDDKMILIILSVPWLLICYTLMRVFFHKKAFSPVVLALASLDVIVMGNATIIGQGTVNIDSMAGGPDNIAEETKIVDYIKEGENGEDYFRISNTTADRGNTNIALREGYTGMSAFHSVYPFGAQDFLDRSRIPYSYHNWSMGVHNSRYNLETFLGTKYYLVDRINPDYGALEFPTKYGTSTKVGIYDNPYGYVDVTTLTEEQMEEYDVHYSQEFLDFLKSDECHKTLLLNTDFIDFGFAFDTIMNEDWLATSFTTDVETGEESPYYNAYEDFNEYPLLRFAILENDDYNTFAKSGKYNAGKVTMNGVTTDLTSYSDDVKTAGTKFRQALLTSGSYVEGNSNPIEIHSAYSSSNKLKVTVYAAQWPATEANPSGEYTYCSLTDPMDLSCLAAYKESNPLEYFNGIRPADIAYDIVTNLTESGSKYPSSKGVLYNSKIVIEPVDKDGNISSLAPNADPSDPTTGAYISIFDTDNIEWRLFDKDNKIITMGKHSYSNYKQAHGYYTDRPVYHIVGIIQTGSKSSPVHPAKPYVYVQSNQDYQKAIDQLKENAIQITSRTDDQIEFTTDYDSDKFVVLNYPYQNGWKLERSYLEEGETITEEVKTYSVDGGFIGFEGLSGDYDYVLTYHSPYLKEGFMITALGLFITVITLMAYPALERKKNPCPYIFSIHKKTDEYCLEAQQRYDTYED